jgi:hypothetical protein
VDACLEGAGGGGGQKRKRTEGGIEAEGIDSGDVQGLRALRPLQDAILLVRMRLGGMGHDGWRRLQDTYILRVRARVCACV